jgi:hypothetical protein
MAFKQNVYTPFELLVRGLSMDFTNVDVQLKRAVPFQSHGREQGEDAARKMDEAFEGPFDVVVDSPAPLEVIDRLDPLILPLLSRAS